MQRGTHSILQKRLSPLVSNGLATLFQPKLVSLQMTYFVSTTDIIALPLDCYAILLYGFIHHISIIQVSVRV